MARTRAGSPRLSRRGFLRAGAAVGLGVATLPSRAYPSCASGYGPLQAADANDLA